MVPRPLYPGSRLASSIMIAATGQHAGKTSVSMALLAGLQDRLGAGEQGSTAAAMARVGYMKPVGQKYVQVDGGLKVDNDVHTAKMHFKLPFALEDMSPVIVDKGDTRRYLTGEISNDEIWARIEDAFHKMRQSCDFLIVEGTGHSGVGSCIGANNAEVAARLGLGVVLVAGGGVGRPVDDLTLHRAFLAAHGAPVRGVVINKILPSKYEMVASHLRLAARRWGLPLLGAVPFSDRLDTPSLGDAAGALGTRLLTSSGVQGCHALKIERFELVTSTLSSLLYRLSKHGPRSFENVCFVTHASRSDLILGILGTFAFNDEGSFGGGDDCGYQNALVLTGVAAENQPDQAVLDMMTARGIPVLLSNRPTAETMKALESIQVKMNAGDGARTAAVVRQCAPHLDLEGVLAAAALGGGEAAVPAPS